MSLWRLVAVLVVLTGCSGDDPVLTDDTDTDTDTDADTRLENEDVVFETRLGNFSIDLLDDEAPLNAANFRQYAKDGFYDGADGGRTTIVHDIQSPLFFEAGLYADSLANKQGRDPVANESAVAPSNRRGTVAAIRGTGVETATSGFFINAADNTYLDGDGDGATVFGRVVRGMDVVDAIMAEQTESRGGFDRIPAEPIEFTTVTVYE